MQMMGDPRMSFFKQSELLQGKTHLKALGERVSPSGTHGASTASGRG